jgi:NosR/NirI family nitrous oxide reductase transcriptional regulator
MDKIGKFIKQEKIKIIATLIVSIIFIFFWINGPILQSIEGLSLESIETKYSNPLMIEKNGINKKKIITNNTLTINDQQTFGYGLLLMKEKANKNWGFIKGNKDNPNLSIHQKEAILKHAKKLYKQNFKIESHQSIEMYYATIYEDKNPIIYIESTGIVKHIRGYAGEIQIGIFIDKDGIKQVNHIASKETKSYLSDIKRAGFYKQFKNISLTKGTQEVDAVSGATITSKAIAKTVSTLIEKGTPYPISNYTEINKINTFNVAAILNKTWIVHSIIIFLMFLFSFQKWKKKTKKSITILSLLSIIYIGFFLNNSFTYVSFIHPFLGTSISSLMGLYSLFVLLGAIWGKNLYCKYICPFGNIQRIIIKVNPINSSRKFFLSNKWIRRVRTALTIILLTGVLLGVRNWSNFELFPNLFGLSTIGVWSIITIITILTTMVYPMLWCRLLCPTGSILDGISSFIKTTKKK